MEDDTKHLETKSDTGALVIHTLSKHFFSQRTETKNKVLTSSVSSKKMPAEAEAQLLFTPSSRVCISLLQDSRPGPFSWD